MSVSGTPNHLPSYIKTPNLVSHPCCNNLNPPSGKWTLADLGGNQSWYIHTFYPYSLSEVFNIDIVEISPIVIIIPYVMNCATWNETSLQWLISFSTAILWRSRGDPCYWPRKQGSESFKGLPGATEQTSEQGRVKPFALSNISYSLMDYSLDVMMAWGWRASPSGSIEFFSLVEMWVGKMSLLFLH